MARRRASPTRHLMPIVILAGLAGAGWLGWRHAASTSGPPRGELARATCALAPAPRLAERIGRVAVEARVQRPPAGVPAASACGWTYFGGQATGHLFTVDSLAAGGVPMDAVAYLRSVATGLEYEFKLPPETVPGLGDEALAAGFGAGVDAPQVVVRRGDRVLVLAFEGLDRGMALAFAGALAEGL